MAFPLTYHRITNSDFRPCSTRGLSTNDIALGHAMLEKAAKLGIGQKLRYR